nr:unnamed protein product [Digitaria exilis]
MAGYDLKDDVDRLFACFKCGVSPPQSAFRERPPRRGKRPRVSPAAGIAGSGGGSSSCAPTPDAAAKKNGGSLSAAIIKFTGRKQMSPVVFYGSPQGVPVKKPHSLLRLLREIRIDLNKQTDLIPRDVVWATFPRQEEAIRYNDMDSKIRHHYEVIQEATQLIQQGSPCHIYFDLEFDTRLSKNRDADEMVDILVAVVFSALRDKYSIEAQEDWITELDSSTEEKFSRHLIIRIPKIAFKDNSHVGAFVSENDKDVFMESLICRLDDNCDKLLICKLDLECQKTLHFDSEFSMPRVMMYIVDFQRAAYYQKCYDPDCQGYRSPLRPVPWDAMPELSSIVALSQTEYQAEVVEIKFDDSNGSGCYLSDGKSVIESYEDTDWWEAAVKFADSIENMEHASDLCNNLEDDDADFWMNAERVMQQIEGQAGSQSNT